MTSGEIMRGDVVVDLAQGSLMQVAEAIGTVAEYREQQPEDAHHADLTTYGPGPLFDVDDDEQVFKCVHVGANLKSLPSGSYDYPRSRLARVPIEDANQDLDRVQFALMRNFLRMLMQVSDGEAVASEAGILADDERVPEDIQEQVIRPALEMEGWM